MANQHVVPNGGIWQVRRENSSKATKTFRTQQEAISYGRQVASNQKSELVIHNRQGKIRDKDSFGKDPCPPRDLKH